MNQSQSISAFTSWRCPSLPSNVVDLGYSRRGRITEPLRSWRDAVVIRLNELVALEPGWDGYRAGPVTFENANFALRMLEVSCDIDAPTPQIVPGVAGDLQVEWHIGDTDIELDIRAPYRVHAWVRNEQTGSDGEESDLTNDFTIVAKWLRNLSDSSKATNPAAA